jgi:Ca-activated chloride channel family protein
MRVLACLTMVCLVALTPRATSSPQSTATPTFSITGTVVDPARTPIPGVALELRRGAAVEARTTTNRDGVWTFEKVAPGAYEIRAMLSGFATMVVPVTISNQHIAAMTIRMKVGALSETVTVTAEASSVTTKISGNAGAVPSGVLGGVVGGIPGAPPPPPPPGAPVPQALHERSQYELRRELRLQPTDHDTASYGTIVENKFRSAREQPLSTFSIDVDTASYANVRRFLNEGRLPPVDAVRLEEMINYFKYDYPDPKGDAPVTIITEYAVTPWNAKTRLALVGMRAKPIRLDKTPPRNLTFLLDVSGSMMPANRLPLVKTAMQMLVDTLREEDRVSIVVYAGNSGVVLRPTDGGRRAEIKRAIEELRAGGSTNGAAGIQLAYDLASENFVKDGINRVILATDGDFNVGVTSQSDLLNLIERKRERGIFLSVLGVGDNNLKDSTMEMLADKGNGNYSYLDSLQEARRVLIAEAGATLVTVAKDVKLQIEFNPHFVEAYRLIGYENRLLRKEDFNNDRKDAGEVGAGHTVTALYEIVPAGEPVPGRVDPLKYQERPRVSAAPAATANTSEMMHIKVRYKAPDGDTSRLLEFPVRNPSPRMTHNLGFASAVAEFGLLLRNSEYRGSATWEGIVSRALGGKRSTSEPDLRR